MHGLYILCFFLKYLSFYTLFWFLSNYTREKKSNLSYTCTKMDFLYTTVHNIKENVLEIKRWSNSKRKIVIIWNVEIIIAKKRKKLRGRNFFIIIILYQSDEYSKSNRWTAATFLSNAFCPHEIPELSTRDENIITLRRC